MQRAYWPTTQWQTALPEEAGVDANRLSLIDNVIQSQHRNVYGVIVIRKGYVVFEKYYQRKQVNDAYNVASITKSLTSALIGIAIDAGYILSVDEPVLGFFPEYMDKSNGIQKREVTIKHLLTMTAPYPFPNWREPLDRMRIQSDWVQYALDMMGQGGRIGTFKYSTAGAHLLSAILTRTTGKCAREFANEYLFKKIGIKKIPENPDQGFGLDDIFGRRVEGWIKDPNGHSTGGWGLTLTLRDMARFGYLYLNDGVWDREPIISKKWIDESTRIHKGNYGYMWWLHQTDDLFAYMATGSGGNVICCVPDKDLLIAISSKVISGHRDRWPLIERYILPAVKD
jgi:CubicO group peptidase (beta-lactamase class C family)